MEVQGLNKATLMKVVDARNFRICGGHADISSAGGSASIAIGAGNNEALWITDMIPTVLDAKGRDLLRCPDIAKDDIVAGINIALIDLTTEPIPLASLATVFDNMELHSGHLLKPNEEAKFKIEVKTIGNQPSVSDYPLRVYITLKGYEMPKTN